MNKIEEVYVFCNRVRWHTAYIPQPEHQVTLALHCCSFSYCHCHCII